ncbi:MAG: DUF305 domain-containing protein, partial [Chloroflexota bacterium]|nr:DUF305 domain-containing protein [Chloroflexota bacterium]
MGRSGSPGRAAIWRAAFITGLITSTFSTLVIVLGSGRIGTGVRFRFMEIGTVALRDVAVDFAPRWYAVVAGLIVHQSADIFWALVFFGLLSRWTLCIRPLALLAVAPLWAVLTDAIEYFVFLPWLQPIMNMQSPYWLGLVVHIASASAYPVFLWLRKPLLGIDQDTGFGRRWAGLLAGALAVLGVVAALGESGREIPWPFVGEQTRSYDASFMRRMAAHHEVGVEMARLAADRAESEDLRTLGRMMVAEQEMEIGILRRWWRSWYEGELPVPTHEEHSAMPGMPPPGAIEQLSRLSGPQFDRRFKELMIAHHEGAVEMSNEAWGRSGQPHLWLLANQIRLAQGRQVKVMMGRHPL